MIKNILISILFGFSLITIAQTENNVFKNFDEFNSKNPSEYCDFLLKERTNGNVFMMGGITNYRLKKIVPETKKKELTESVWGITEEGTSYINSYPYSKIVGYNKILGNGYYHFFIGEPARLKNKQVELGIINEGDSQRSVCCKTTYVILPTGKIQWLTPQLLLELIKDNESLKTELSNEKIMQEDADKLFDYLTRYNKSKL
jgi:hypothetical protein